MNSEIVACVKKGGEMYIEFARSSKAAESAAGSTKYPVRRPGATVFEKDDVYVTSSPPSSSCSVGGASPS